MPLIPVALSGGLTIYNLGKITAGVAFESEDYLYPVGFVSTCIHQSFVSPGRLCLYKCSIVLQRSEGDGDVEGEESVQGSRPAFEVVCEDSPETTFTADNPEDCWIEIMNAIHDAADGPLIERRRGIDGHERFGLTHPVVTALLQSYLDGAKEQVTQKYKRKAVHVQEHVYWSSEVSPAAVSAMIPFESFATLTANNTAFSMTHMPSVGVSASEEVGESASTDEMLPSAPTGLTPPSSMTYDASDTADTGAIDTEHPFARPEPAEIEETDSVPSATAVAMTISLKTAANTAAASSAATSDTAGQAVASAPSVKKEDARADDRILN